VAARCDRPVVGADECRQAVEVSAVDDPAVISVSTLSGEPRVVVFVVIEFALVIVPFAFPMARPEGIKAAVERFKVWLFKHALQVVGAVALVAGGYMVISGVLRLS
jgi:hypothetical protein